VILSQPTTLHSNGADLSWTPFSGSGSFQKFEVHRASTANFTPSSTTLLTTITDAAVTSYRDTTAKAGAVFYYNVVANTSPSNYVQVTLPADGHASKVIQPGPEGKDTYNWFDPTSTICSTYGKSDHVTLGTDTNRLTRIFFGLPVNDIATGSTIQSATLALWHYETAPATANSLRAFRVTHDWAQGSSNSSEGACTGDGVTWYEANGGLAWGSQGGDFASGASDQSAAVSVPAGQAPAWTTFNITPISQQWVNGTAPNYGVMIKLDNEAIVASNLLRFYASDYTGSASFRPKLTVTYTDGSHAIAPTVAVGSPVAGSVVRGSTVSLSAGATDDRRVDKVEFYVDGSLVGTSTAAPFTISWDSTSPGNGTRTITAKAYDDAGNVTTSSRVAVTVSNYLNPTTSITSPAANASVTGTVSVSATASVASGLTVSKLEFYFDNTLFATVNAPANGATSTVSWNTFDSAQPAFDGTRVLTTKVYDSSGLIIQSATRSVTVNNTVSTMYKGTIAPALATGVPQGVVYDPALGGNQTTYPVKINLTNTSTVTWSNTTTFLRYRWVSSDSPAVTIDGPNVSLPTSIPAGGSANNITVTVSPPTLDDGVNAAQYNLRFDVFDSSTSSWFAVKGNQPSDNPVIVSKALKTSLGLEKYYAYATQDIGGGMQSLVNVANGDSILHYTPFTSPGRGLATVVGLTYNSLENHSDSPAGNNWSLSISSLSRFGNPIDIHPNNADTIAGRSNRWIEFIDGDGTPHRFQGFVDGSGVVYWIEPPGVHLYLRQYSTTDTTRWWALTRPDRVTFFYNQDGYPTFVTDRFGNTLTYTLTAVQPGDDPGGPKFHITSVQDAGGRSYTISYFVKADSVKSHVRGKIKSISDHSGHALNFAYYDDGNLLRLTERGGTNADGTALADRSWVFTYTTPSGGVSGCSANCDAPAIPTASARINPDPKTPSESTRIYSVREPDGNADTSRPETKFFYYGPASSNLDRWKLSTLADRGGNSTTFAWDNVNRVATVTPPAPGGQSRVTRYAYDTDGKPTTITNPLQQTTVLQWNGDFAVTSLQETGGASYVTTYTDNENGYLTDQTDPLAHTTHLGYTNLAIDSNDVAAHWCTSAIAATTPCYPRSIGHISLMTSKTDPLGMPAQTSYTWHFFYDGTNTKLDHVTDPLNNTTFYTYNTDGTIATVKDPRNNTTTYSYDANGLVTQVVDPMGFTTKSSYDSDGRILWIQDANHAASSGPNDNQYRTKFFYDSFHRLGRTTTPKFPVLNPPGSTVPTGTLITSDVGYDANNNATSQTTPYYNTADRFVTTTTYDVMDRQTLVTSPDTSADPAGERTKYQYDSAGRLTQVTLPIGMQSPDGNNTHNIFYAYDALDRVVSQTRNNVQNGTLRALVTVVCYNTAGDMTSVTQPLAGLTPSTINCVSSTLSYTTYYQYYLDHRVSLTKDPNGNTQTIQYDNNGNTKTVTDANTNPTNYSYDELNRLTKVEEPFVASGGSVSRKLTTMITYDAAGNRSSLISPRAFDVGNGGPYTNFVTKYEYDADNRLTKTYLPVDTTSPINLNFSTQYYVHQQYDANGNVKWTSVPVEQSDPSLVAPEKKMSVGYYDTGSIYSSKDGTGPTTYFDYTAAGQQSLKVPSDAAGNLDMAHRMQWTYFSDGQLKQRQDRGNQLISYTYDADNVLKTAKNAAGATDASTTDITVTPDDMDRLATVQSLTSAATTKTTYLYDLNSNISDSVQDAQTAPTVKPGRNLHYDYDMANWLKDQCTLTTPPTPATCTNPTNASDQRIVTTYWPTGLTKSREQDQGGASWTAKQTTTWDYFANGKLNLLNTYNGTTAATKVESHTVAYTADPANTASVYFDGNRTRDSFFMLGSGTTACRVSTAPCNDDYLYDPRDRVVKETKGDLTSTTYFGPKDPSKPGLDESGNIFKEQVVSGGVTTTKDYTYSGNQLQTVTTNGADVSKYWYNDDGDLWCVTSSAGSKANCPISAQTTPPSSVKQAYAYDYLFRLQNYRAFNNGQLTDCANYKYDPLDRQVWEGETHGTGISCSDSKTTQFTFAGLTNKVTQEQQSSGGTLQTTKDYSYDVYGHRASETVTPNGQSASTYTYSYNVHDSVSLLLDSSGNTKASYAYRPYGDQDSTLSGGDPDKNNPFNAYRYAAKRFDSGSQTIDTGARRFATDTSKFLQPDQFNNALSNLALGTDPITQNRYSLAGGNPLSFIEWDGHYPISDGGGSNDPSPSPSGQQLGADALKTAESQPVWSNPGTSQYERASADQKQPAHWNSPHRWIDDRLDQFRDSGVGNWIANHGGRDVAATYDTQVLPVLRALPGRETDYRKISLVLDASAAAANTVSAVVTYGAAAYAGAAGGPYAAETAVIGGAIGYVSTAPLRLAANAMGTVATGSSTIADAKGGVTGTDTVRSWLYTGIGWLDPEPLTGTIVDYDTVWSDWESLQDAEYRAGSP
jgi:RHS repeat-associated protein